MSPILTTPLRSRWHKLETVIRWFDGLMILAPLGAVLGLALLALIDSDSRYNNIYGLVAGLYLALLAVSFVPPYLGMRRGIRLRWSLHLLPLLTPWAFEIPLAQLLPSTRFGPVNKLYTFSAPSMEPTLREGQLVGARLLQGNEAIQRGDIVVFRSPLEDISINAKRVVAIAGDVIMMQNHQVYLNGQLLKESYAVHTDKDRDESFLDDLVFSFDPVTLSEGSYFVTGSKLKTRKS